MRRFIFGLALLSFSSIAFHEAHAALVFGKGKWNSTWEHCAAQELTFLLSDTGFNTLRPTKIRYQYLLKTYSFDMVSPSGAKFTGEMFLDHAYVSHYDRIRQETVREGSYCNFTNRVVKTSRAFILYDQAGHTMHQILGVNPVPGLGGPT